MSDDPFRDNILAAIEHERAMKALRRKRGWRVIGIAAFGCAIVFVVFPLLFYVYWQWRGGMLLREELAKIKASGTPLTTQEMEDYYKVPPGTRDITEIWLDATAPFGTKAYQTTTENVPIVGRQERQTSLGPPMPVPSTTNGSTEDPRRRFYTLDQPYTPEEEKLIQDWHSLHKDKLAALHSAAQETGEARYPRNFRQAFPSPPELQQIRSARTSLRLEFSIFARQPDIPAALENLRIRSALAETYRHDVSKDGLMQRGTIHHERMTNMRELAQAGLLTDRQLADLQQSLRPLEYHRQWREVLLGERAELYCKRHLSGRKLSLPKNFTGTTYDPGGIERAEDCAMMLKLVTETHAVAGGPWPQSLQDARNIESDFYKHLGDHPINKWRYEVSIIFFEFGPRPSNFAAMEVFRDLTDVALAVERYRLKHDMLPSSLSDLVPDFLPAVPLDLYSGDPIRYQSQPDRVVLYSVGEDQKDDGGKMNESFWSPDIVVEVFKHEP